MVQGSLKKATPTGPGRKPGVRSVAPKKAGLIKQKKLTKVRTDSLPGFSLQTAHNAVWRRRQAIFELLAGGKKDRLQKERNAARKDGTLKSGPKKAT
ncbi:hypothetical protein N7530_010325 [Penicillium desertorum]|uniref:Uncharacterized protein n=1 Tax=Penicillium desertorum TaxID=1303715 RepID=A0A9W9WK59_9EURO|nr:hypothetical protein N7530_010325 [Penicillium desertorum]